MRIIFLANTGWYLYNFRRDLIDTCRSRGHDVFLICPQDQYSDRLKKSGCSVVNIELSRHQVRLLKELRTLHCLYKLFKSIRPTVCHSFTLRCTFLAILANSLVGTRVRVYSLTGMGYLFSRTGIIGWLLSQITLSALRTLLRFGSNQVIVQNSEDFRLLKPLFKSPSVRLHLILGSGVNTEYFRPALNRTSESEGKVIVLMATRLLRDKGIYEFVEAAKIIGKLDPEIQFWIAGEPDPGNPSSVSTESIERWHDYKNLAVLGHRSDMLSLYQKSDILVLPSYREGLPRCLIEACACGLAIIATDVPGCNEVIIDGQNGLLVSPRNAQQIADGIRELANSPDRRDQMGALSRTRAVRLFDQKQINDQTISLYVINH